jgi:hypothetical protein
MPSSLGLLARFLAAKREMETGKTNSRPSHRLFSELGEHMPQEFHLANSVLSGRLVTSNQFCDSAKRAFLEKYQESERASPAGQNNRHAGLRPTQSKMCFGQ